MSTADSTIESVLGRTDYRDGEALSAAALADDSLAYDAAYEWSQKSAHHPGIAGGLWIEIVIDAKKKAQTGFIVSSGAAVDRSGRLLLWVAREPKAFPAESDEAFGVWLRYREAVVDSTSSDFQRLDHTPELVVAPIKQSGDCQQPGGHDAVFLGTLRRETTRSVWTVDEAGRAYVGAFGARIESPSRRARMLLGPERPGDSRRFAVGVRPEGREDGDPNDVLSWESTGSIALRADTLIQALSVQESDRSTLELPAPPRLVVGVASVQLTTADVLDPCLAWDLLEICGCSSLQPWWNKLLDASRVDAQGGAAKCRDQLARQVVRVLNGVLRAVSDESMRESQGIAPRGAKPQKNSRLWILKFVALALRERLSVRISGLADNKKKDFVDFAKRSPRKVTSDVVLCRLVIDELFEGQIRPLTRLPACGLQFRGPGPAEPEPSPGRMRLVDIEKDGQRIRELRITIPDPGEKNHPERYRCSIGMSVKEHTIALDNPIRQTGAPRGILSVLADHSVELMSDVNVFAGHGTIMPGLVIELTPPAKDGVEPGGDQSSAPAQVLGDALIWDSIDVERLPAGDSPEGVKLMGKLHNVTDVNIASLTLFLTVYAKGGSEPPLKQGTFKTVQPLAANTAVDAATLFGDVSLAINEFIGKTIVAHVLLLGANEHNAIVQTQVQFERG